MNVFHRVALYPGDGIGQEVTASAAEVLNSLDSRGGQACLEFTEFPWGRSLP